MNPENARCDEILQMSSNRAFIHRQNFRRAPVMRSATTWKSVLSAMSDLTEHKARSARSLLDLKADPDYLWSMPTTPHIEKHFTAGDAVRDIVIGMSDGLTVPFALAAGLT